MKTWLTFLWTTFVLVLYECGWGIVYGSKKSIFKNLDNDYILGFCERHKQIFYNIKKTVAHMQHATFYSGYSLLYFVTPFVLCLHEMYTFILNLYCQLWTGFWVFC